MLDQSRNFTLQEINYEETSEQGTIDGLSSIHYEEEYRYLQDFSFNGDHLQLSQIKMNPQRNNYQIRFYEQVLDPNEKESQLRGFGGDQQQKDRVIKHKIATINVKEDGQNIKQAIKMPVSKERIEMEIETKGEGIMRGYLNNQGNLSQSHLFNEQGKKVASLHYHVKSNKLPEIRTLDIVRQDSSFIQPNTLHSYQFPKKPEESQSDLSFIPREKVQRVQQFPRKFQPPVYPSQMQTLKCSFVQQTIKPLSKLGKPIKKVMRSDSEDQKASQVDYRGQDQNEMMQDRVSYYRNPIQPNVNTQKEVIMIDYLALKRSQEQLGISNIDIQSMMNPYHLLEKQKSRFSQTSSYVPVSSSSEAPSIFPITVISSEKIKVKPPVIDCGISTYTPLPSRQPSSTKSHKSSFSNKSTKEKDSLGKKPYQENNTSSRDRTSQKAQNTFVIPRQNVILEQSLMNEVIPSSSRSNARSIQNLSLKNKVFNIRLGQEKSRAERAASEPPSSYSKQQSNAEWSSSNSKAKEDQSEVSNDQSEFFLNISNLSINFRRKTFGFKNVELAIGDSSFKTQNLNGNNLIWIGKQYMFKKINPQSELEITVRGQNDETAVVLGKVKINVSELFLNSKQSYYQTLLLNRTEVLAIIIIGFEIGRKFKSSRQIYPRKGRQSHANTEVAIRSKTTHKNEDKIHTGKTKKIAMKESQQTQADKLPSPRVNPVRFRKYIGGKNIKIGRANRFVPDWHAELPGPGDYEIESSFSRHAFKQY